MIVGIPPFCGDTPEEVFMNIMNYDGNLQFPENKPEEEDDPGVDISDLAKDFIQGLISVPEKRLGKNGSQQIKQHDWLAIIDWNNFTTQIKPPFVPNLESKNDTSYFPSTQEVNNSENNNTENNQSEEQDNDEEDQEHKSIFNLF